MMADAVFLYFHKRGPCRGRVVIVGIADIFPQAFGQWHNAVKFGAILKHDEFNLRVGVLVGLDAIIECIVKPVCLGVK